MSEKMTLKQLRCLEAVEHTRHFRRAAELVGITQPSLTVQIQSLEEILGARLVERSRSGVSMTPFGREVVTRARLINEHVQQLTDLSYQARGGLTGTIRLGTTPTMGPYLLPSVVGELHKDYKHLKLYIRDSAPKELEDELYRGVHDVLLTQIPTMSDQFTETFLFREPLFVIMAKDHPLKDLPELKPKHLTGQTILTLGPLYRLHDQVRQLSDEVGGYIAENYEGTSLDTLRQMVGMGMGLSFLPALYVRSEINSRSEVLIKPFKGRPIYRQVGLLWRKSAGRAESYKALISIIQQVAQKKFREIELPKSD